MSWLFGRMERPAAYNEETREETIFSENPPHPNIHRIFALLLILRVRSLLDNVCSEWYTRLNCRYLPIQAPLVERADITRLETRCLSCVSV